MGAKDLRQAVRDADRRREDVIQNIVIAVGCALVIGAAVVFAAWQRRIGRLQEQHETAEARLDDIAKAKRIDSEVAGMSDARVDAEFERLQRSRGK